MDHTFINALKIKNIDSPFTELFTLLKCHKNLPNGFLPLLYESEELKVMHQHIDNAIDALLRGLQDLGNLLSIAIQDKEKITEDLNNIGFFISTISNLTEALNTLRIDTDYVLRQRGETKY